MVHPVQAVVVGAGLLMGNGGGVVGEIYTPEDQRRDAGFSIFYMGINLGAFLAPLVMAIRKGFLPRAWE